MGYSFEFTDKVLTELLIIIEVLALHYVRKKKEVSIRIWRKCWKH